MLQANFKKYTLILISALSIIIGAAFGAMITVESGQKIQDAIDLAFPGDTIQVKEGIYFENLIISKNIALKGDGRPLIDAMGNDSAITILAEGVTITGFNVTNSSDSGIEVKSNGNLISNNTAIDGHSGIVIDGCSNNTVSGNVVLRNQETGICLENSIKNIILSNIAEENHNTGIELEDSADNYIKWNNAVNNSNDGIELVRSTNNAIEGNIARENKDGICLEDGSKNNTVSNNNVSYNHIDGILIRSSHENVFIRNDVSQNKKAFFLEASNENIITENDVIDNMDGVFINYYSSNSKIHKNRLAGSLHYNAYDESSANQWDNGTLGNYYSNFDKNENGCLDVDGNGVCDSYYIIPGGSSSDRYASTSSPLKRS